jgi:hypothetical protein
MVTKGRGMRCCDHPRAGYTDSVMLHWCFLLFGIWNEWRREDQSRQAIGSNQILDLIGALQ